VNQLKFNIMKKMKFESLSMSRFESAKLLDNQLRAVTGGDCCTRYGCDNKGSDWIDKSGNTTWDNTHTTDDGKAPCND
jgi:natural product precursor